MADDADPIEQLLDAALYVPLGLFLELRERFPELADKGRQHLTTQVNVARMVGQFAVQMGTKQVQSYLARQRAATAEPSPPAPSGASGVAAPSDPGDAAAEATAGAFTTTEPASSPAESAAPSADELPIAGYDTLAASQIVARLDGLQPDQLAAVAAYEASHRNRKTVLGKVAQLRKGA